MIKNRIIGKNRRTIIFSITPLCRISRNTQLIILVMNAAVARLVNTIPRVSMRASQDGVQFPICSTWSKNIIHEESMMLQAIILNRYDKRDGDGFLYMLLWYCICLFFANIADKLIAFHRKIYIFWHEIFGS